MPWQAQTLACLNIHAQDFARLALYRNFERAAADLAISREPLARHARVNGHLGRLPAKRTHNGFANFHAQNLTALGQSAMVQTGESVLDKY